MKLRSPELPDDLVASWSYFLEKVPSWLWTDHTAKTIGGKITKNEIGLRLLERCNEIKTKLGDHYTENPLAPPPEKKAKHGGDPKAFEKWIRWMQDKHKKDGRF